MLFLDTRNVFMAFDFGTKNIGVAVGQNITYTAQPITICKNINGIPDWQKIKILLSDWNPIIVIIGLPIHVNNNYQFITNLAYKFSCQFYNLFHIKTILYDERFSTVEAKRNILNNVKNRYHALTKEKINAESAAIILESWLQENQYYKTN